MATKSFAGNGKNNDEYEYKMYKVVNNFICTFHIIIPGFRLSSGCKHRKRLAHWPHLSHGKRDVIRASNSLIVHYQMHVHCEQGSSQVKPSVFTLVWNVQITIHGFWIRQEMDLIFRQLLSSLEINCLLQFRANQYLFIPLTVWNTSNASCLMTSFISTSNQTNQYLLKKNKRYTTKFSSKIPNHYSY